MRNNINIAYDLKLNKFEVSLVKIYVLSDNIAQENFMAEWDCLLY